MRNVKKTNSIIGTVGGNNSKLNTFNRRIIWSKKFFNRADAQAMVIKILTTKQI